MVHLFVTMTPSPFSICLLASVQALELFSPRELELLVCGNPVLDLEALERVTQ